MRNSHIFPKFAWSLAHGLYFKVPLLFWRHMSNSLYSVSILITTLSIFSCLVASIQNPPLPWLFYDFFSLNALYLETHLWKFICELKWYSLRDLFPSVTSNTINPRQYCVKCFIWGFSDNSGITDCVYKVWLGLVREIKKKKASHFCFQFSSAAQLILTLCDHMDCSTPGLLVHCQLLELA